MGFVLFLCFVVVPIAEVAIFIHVGGWLGLWPTVGLVIATAAIGSALIRHQGLTILHMAHHELTAGRIPMRQLLEGVCILFAGALLLTPGFLTDAIGLSLLVPRVRQSLGQLAVRHFERAAARDATSRRPPAADVVIDGQWEELDGESSPATAAPKPSPRTASIPAGHNRHQAEVVPPGDPW